MRQVPADAASQQLQTNFIWRWISAPPHVAKGSVKAKTFRQHMMSKNHRARCRGGACGEHDLVRVSSSNTDKVSAFLHEPEHGREMIAR